MFCCLKPEVTQRTQVTQVTQATQVIYPVKWGAYFTGTQLTQVTRNSYPSTLNTIFHITATPINMIHPRFKTQYV